MLSWRWSCRGWVVMALASLSVGCAATPGGMGGHPQDPFEATNRSISAFNDELDSKLLKPVAITYKASVPEVAQTGVRNFFGNLSDIWSTFNLAMQLKPMDTAETGLRATVNTVFGVYGLIDWGTRIGLQRHNADFGQTLGYWGVPSGPYIVLPVLGPSNVRDTAGWVLDSQGGLWGDVTPASVRYSGTALNVVDKRASFLGFDRQLDQVALDKYSFIRDAYMQRRRAATQRTNPKNDGGDDPDGGGQRYDQ
jgi:phospholipid-binding lipoprotein MlaA